MSQSAQAQPAGPTVTHLRRLSDGRVLCVEREIGETPRISSIEAGGRYAVGELNRAMELIIAVAEAYQALADEEGRPCAWSEYICRLPNGRTARIGFMPGEQQFRITPDQKDKV